MTHHWLHIRTIHEPDLPQPDWRWRKIALRDDGYLFYGRGTTEDAATLELDSHVDDPIPPFTPLNWQEMASFRRKP